jgi:hypothetical protein
MLPLIWCLVLQAVNPKFVVYRQLFSAHSLFKWRWCSFRPLISHCFYVCIFYLRSRLGLKCDGTRAETRFRLLAKRTSPFKSAGASVHSTSGRRAVHISLQGLYCTCKPVFCSHVTLTGYPHHSLVSPSLLLPCVTVCHHISTGL